MKNNPIQPNSNSIKSDNNGITVCNCNKVIQSIKWEEIWKVEVYKLDLMITDLVCLEIFGINKINTDEEMNGFDLMCKSIELYLTLNNKDWRSEIIFPAFKSNNMVIYLKGDPPNKSIHRST